MAPVGAPARAGCSTSAAAAASGNTEPATAAEAAPSRPTAAPGVAGHPSHPDPFLQPAASSLWIEASRRAK